KKVVKTEIEASNIMVVHGEIFIHDNNLPRLFQNCMQNKETITVLTFPKIKELEQDRKKSSNIIYFDDSMHVVEQNHENKIETQYDYFELPVYFCPQISFLDILFKTNNERVAKKLRESSKYANQVYSLPLERGYFVRQMESEEDFLDISTFLKIIQNNFELYSVDELAWRRGLITSERLQETANVFKNTKYGIYLNSLVNKK
ncbi:MAG: hypothetical protein WC389_17305, partial [Lutibacter sp.]